MNDSPERSADTVDATIQRLIRLHNLQTLAVIVCGMAAVAYVQTTRVFSEAPPYLGRLTALRIAIPVGILILTALWTQLALSKLSRDPQTGVDAVLRTFRRTKLLSMWLLSAASLFAALCLVVGHRTYDVLLAFFSLGLLLLTRPSREGFEAFRGLAAKAPDQDS